MDGIIKQIDKWQPTFKKIATNKYLRAIRDGFISLMPIIIFSSLFLLVAYVPNIWGFMWPENVEAALNKAYNYSMGALAFFAAANVSRALAVNLNLELPKTNQVPVSSVMFATQVAFLLVAVDPVFTDEGLNLFTGFIGSKGLIAAFLVSFIVPNIYFWCFKHKITIKLPDEVPQNISEAFQNIIPFSISTTVFWLFDIGFRKLTGTNLAAWIIEALAPLFTAADGYIGLAIIYGLMAFFWFIGIHGPSIVEPAVTAIYMVNVEQNLHLYQAGQHAANVLTPGTQYAVATLGGTGATLVITYMFATLAKSKEMKAVGRASAIPVTFGVNEPILFGAPLILNPTFMIPFIFAPIANVWLFKFFVDVIKMPSFIYNLPWTTPGPLYIFMGTGFSLIALLFAVVVMALDFVIYYPFFKAYDRMKVAEEKEQEQEAETVEKKITESITNTDVESKEAGNVVYNASELINLNQTKDGQHLNVLVLCAGGGTSGILAKSLNQLSEKEHLPLEAAATAFGNHTALISDMDVVVLAPQMATMKDELQKECDLNNAKMITTNGKEYINMTRNADKALKLITETLV